jgi:hypothetical protein
LPARFSRVHGPPPSLKRSYKTQPFFARLSTIPQLKSALALRAVHDIRNGIDARPTPAEVTAFGLRQEMAVIVAEASALRVRR